MYVDCKSNIEEGTYIGGNLLADRLYSENTYL